MNQIVRQLYNQFKTDKTLIEISLPNRRAFTFQHERAHKADLKENLLLAEILNENDYSVVINEHKLDIVKRKNPEYLIIESNGNRVLSDRKTPITPRGIRGRFEGARNQSLTHLVVKLDSQWSKKDVVSGISNGFKFNMPITKCIVVRNRLAVEITRENYETGKISEIKEPLYQEERERP
jgi:hypothetical protein